MRAVKQCMLRLVVRQRNDTTYRRVSVGILAGLCVALQATNSQVMHLNMLERCLLAQESQEPQETS